MGGRRAGPGGGPGGRGPEGRGPGRGGSPGLPALRPTSPAPGPAPTPRTCRPPGVHTVPDKVRLPRAIVRPLGRDKGCPHRGRPGPGGGGRGLPSWGEEQRLAALSRRGAGSGRGRGGRAAQVGSLPPGVGRGRRGAARRRRALGTGTLRAHEASALGARSRAVFTPSGLPGPLPFPPPSSLHFRLWEKLDLEKGRTNTNKGRLGGGRRAQTDALSSRAGPASWGRAGALRVLRPQAAGLAVGGGSRRGRGRGRGRRAHCLLQTRVPTPGAGWLCSCNREAKAGAGNLWFIVKNR